MERERGREKEKRTERPKDRDGGRREVASKRQREAGTMWTSGGRQRDGGQTHKERAHPPPRPPHSSFALLGAQPEFCPATLPHPPLRQGSPDRLPLLGVGVEPGSLGCLKQTGRGPGATLLGDGPRAPASLRSLSQAALGTHLGIHLRLRVPPSSHRPPLPGRFLQLHPVE